MKIGSSDISAAYIGSTAINKVYIGSTEVWSAVDPDAQAFITAAGITDATQQAAINTLVVDLKADGIWSKMKAIYPFVGGTASTHKYNLKDPRDLDAAFRLVFNGGWTHSSTGATPNGTNGYADTRLNPNNELSLNSVHISTYSRNNAKMAGIIGSSDASLANALYMYPRYSSNNSEVSRMFSNSGTPIGTSDSSGHWVASRVVSTSWKTFRNASTWTTRSVSTSAKTTRNTYIGAGNLNGVPEYGVGEFAFSSIGDGLTDAEVTNFYTAVQAFQTSLSRQV